MLQLLKDEFYCVLRGNKEQVIGPGRDVNSEGTRKKQGAVKVLTARNCVRESCAHGCCDE